MQAMKPRRITRRHLLGGVATGAFAAALSCRRNSESHPESGATGTDGAQRVKVGLLVPQAGVYAPLGVDLRRGWELFLERHGGKLGKREVTTIVADEGESPQT